MPAKGEAKVSTGPRLEFSKREIEVATLVAEGLGRKEVGKRLFISTHTVGAHITNLSQKLGREMNTALVTRLAVSKGWVSKEWEPPNGL